MKPRHSMRSRLTALSLTGVFVLAACGGGDGGDSSESAGEQLPAVADVLEVSAAANVESNLLPDLVVDNLKDDNKVNLRNFGVSDKPILLWMWAPH